LYSLNGTSKPQLKDPKPIIKQEKIEAEEEEEVSETSSKKEENEAAPESKSEEEEISETPEIFTKASSNTAAKKDEDEFLPEIPSHAQYLIVGGGTAAMSAFKAIRAKDPAAKVLVVTEENYKPYMRPPLSKDLWTTDDEKLVNELKFKQYNGNERSLLFLEDDFYVKPKLLNTEECANGGVAVVTGKRVH
jgi:apoptosis-inducing factor 1